MLTLQAANSQYELQQKIAVTTTAAVNKLWGNVSDNFDSSWAGVRSDVLTLVENGRLAAVTTAVGYTDQVLSELGQSAPAVGQIIPAAFVAFAPDGTDMGELLDTAVIRSKMAVKAGASSAEALQTGNKWLTGALLTVMADTSRQVVAADIAHRPLVTGYIRMLNGPSCARCVLLAGKWFRWNQGFDRHPRCDCRHVPSTDEQAMKDKGYISDPYEYFRSLSVRDQERTFGKLEAEAIRDHGADIYRVMNVKMRGLGTVKGNLKYGTPNKRTVDDILAHDVDRKFVIENLKYHGYITGPQTAGGNILGRYNIGFGQLGKGGAARAASDATTNALVTGIRDPLNRYTMTAAERRLYDAHYKYEYATRTGTLARSVGQNSADIYTQSQKATAAQISQLRSALEKQLAKLENAPSSVRILADKLGYSSAKLGNVPNVSRFTRPLGAQTKTGGAGGGFKPPSGPVSGFSDGFIEPNSDDLQHILDGDAYGGGHRFGANMKKSEFPQGWDEAKLVSVAKEIQHRAVFSGKTIEAGPFEDTIDGVKIRMLLERDEETQKLFVSTMIPVAGDGVTVWSSGKRKAKPLREN